jgi:hypothetical protein
MAEKLFAFLPSDCGFAPPEMAVDEHALLAVLTFKGQNLAIQLLLDVRAQDVDCKVARVSNGKVTEHYGRDGAGKLDGNPCSRCLRERRQSQSVHERYQECRWRKESPSLSKIFPEC